MINLEEAREQAWERAKVLYSRDTYPDAVYRAGWDARGQYDEQRIAALVAAALRAQLFFAARQGKLGIYDRIGHDLTEALRALAGQTGELERPHFWGLFCFSGDLSHCGILVAVRVLFRIPVRAVKLLVLPACTAGSRRHNSRYHH